MKTNYVSVVISFGIIENGLKEWKENGGKKMHLIAFYKSKNDTFSLVKVYVNVKYSSEPVLSPLAASQLVLDWN